MAEAKKNDTPRLDCITQAGIGRYPRLNTPDDKFSPGDPKYDVQLIIDPNEDALFGKESKNLIATAEVMRDEFAATVKARLLESAAEFKAAKQGAKAKAASDKAAALKVADVGKMDVDNEGEETGKVIIRPKMKAKVKRKDGSVQERKPVVFDAKGLKLKNPPIIGGGSKMKLAITIQPYHMESTNEVGITFYLNAVQIIELVTGGERSAEGYGFGAEEGYEAEAEESFGGNAGTSGDGEDF